MKTWNIKSRTGRAGRTYLSVKMCWEEILEIYKNSVREWGEGSMIMSALKASHTHP